MGFYSDNASSFFRFGDVVRNFITAKLTVDDPVSSIDKLKYQLELSSDLYAIVSPCCSIKDQIMLLCPLSPVRKAFLKNPYFCEDLTRINRLVSPDDARPPNEWNDLSETERRKAMDRGPGYTNLEIFVFAGHKWLPNYQLKWKETEIEPPPYMVDFRRIFSLKCRLIEKDQKHVPIGSKLLELSPKTRQELGLKMGHFFARTPDEDRPFLE